MNGMGPFWVVICSELNWPTQYSMYTSTCSVSYGGREGATRSGDLSILWAPPPHVKERLCNIKPLTISISLPPSSPIFCFPTSTPLLLPLNITHRHHIALFLESFCRFLNPHSHYVLRGPAAPLNAITSHAGTSRLKIFRFALLDSHVR